MILLCCMLKISCFQYDMWKNRLLSDYNSVEIVIEDGEVCHFTFTEASSCTVSLFNLLAHLRRAKYPSRMPFPTEPFSPNGLVRGRNGSPLVVVVAGVGRPLGLPGSVAISGTEVFRRP